MIIDIDRVRNAFLTNKYNYEQLVEITGYAKKYVRAIKMDMCKNGYIFIRVSRLKYYVVSETEFIKKICQCTNTYYASTIGVSSCAIDRVVRMLIDNGHNVRRSKMLSPLTYVDRNNEIIDKYKSGKYTYAQLGKEYAVTKQRIRSIITPYNVRTFFPKQ